MNIDSYIRRVASPIGDNLCRALEPGISKLGVRAFVQIYFRSGSHYYPCYLTNLDKSERVLEAIGPTLEEVAIFQQEFLRDVLGSRHPEFWIWGLNKEENLRSIVNGPTSKYERLPKDLLVASFCRLTHEQCTKAVSAWSWNSDERLEFLNLNDRVEENLRQLEEALPTGELSVTDYAFLIELASLALVVPGDDDTSENQLDLIFTLIRRFLKSPKSNDIKKRLLELLNEKFVTNITIPLQVEGLRVGLLSIGLLTNRVITREVESSIKSIMENPFRSAAAQLEQLFLALLPLWVIHSRTHGRGEVIDLAKLMNAKKEHTCINTISAATEIVAELISLAQDLEFSLKEVLAKKSPTVEEKVVYAIIRVVFDLRDYLLAGRVLVLTNHGKILTPDKKRARYGSKRARYGSAFLMMAAGFKEHAEYFSKTVNGRYLQVGKPKISQAIRKASEALAKRWRASPHVGFHTEEMNNRDAGLILVWAKAWEKSQCKIHSLAADQWLWTLRKSVRNDLEEEFAPQQEDAMKSTIRNTIDHRLLLISDVQHLLSASE